jgi:hypothetical protein
MGVSEDRFPIPSRNATSDADEKAMCDAQPRIHGRFKIMM